MTTSDTTATDRTAPVAILTGASRGLGLAVSRALLAQGWTVVGDGRDRAALDRAALELGAAGTFVPVPGDVADEQHRIDLLQQALAAGPLRALVHNASVLGSSPRPGLAAYPLDVLRHVYEVNVLAPLRLSQLALPHLEPGGRIVAVTSDAAREPYAGWGGYGSSKAALEQAFAILGAEHPLLRVLVVDPGDMRTRMHAEAFPGEDISDRPLPEVSVPGFLRLLLGHQPSGRYQARALTTAESA